MAGQAARKRIYQVAIILTALTAFEFLIAFTWEPISESIGIALETGRTMKNVLFILLTIIKAFYIVAYFMHLRDELVRMIASVLVPFIFIVWLIIGLIIEGKHYGNLTKDAYDPDQEQSLIEENAQRPEFDAIFRV